MIGEDATGNARGDKFHTLARIGHLNADEKEAATLHVNGSCTAPPNGGSSSGCSGEASNTEQVVDSDQNAWMRGANNARCAEDNKRNMLLLNCGCTAGSKGRNASRRKGGAVDKIHEIYFNKNKCVQDENDAECVEHWDSENGDNMGESKAGGRIDTSLLRDRNSANGCSAIPSQVPMI